jgi:hypothetical protein
MVEEASFLGGVQKATAVDRINSAIIFGEYGTGKTFLAASADEITDYSPVLIVDIEGSAAGVGRKYPNVNIIPADTHQKLELLNFELLNKKHPYKTVIFDTGNVAQSRAEKFFRQKPENANNKFGVWADLKDWTLDWHRKMHHAPFLAIFIYHAQVDKDENTGKMITTVKIAGSSRTDVPAVPDLIGYLGFTTDDDGKPIRSLQVGRSTSIITKNRFGLPDVILPSEGSEGPTIYDIQKAIIEARGE